MGRVQPLEEGNIKRARASVYLFKVAASFVRARVEKSVPEKAARNLFGSVDPVTAEILKAATGQATIGSPGWAGALAATSVDDFVLSISVLSAAAGLIANGMRLDLGHFASVRLPARTFDPAAAGSWLAESQPIPVKNLNVTSSSLYPRKLAVITSWTEELARASNVEEVARALISESAAQAFDAALLGTQADDGAVPQGLLSGIAPIGSAGRLGSNLDTAAQDIANLAAELAKHGAGLDPVIVAAVPQATVLKMLVAGKGWDIPILPSAALAAGVVVMIEAGSFASAFDGTPDFSTADVALLHYETAPGDIVSTGGTAAVPTRSLMQTNGVALRMVLRCAWGMRNRAHVAYLTGANSSFENHIAPERDAMHKAVGAGIGDALFEVKTELVHRIEREVATLRNEQTEMKAFVRTALVELERANTKVANLQADLEGERKERQALAVALAEERGRLNAVLRDFRG